MPTQWVRDLALEHGLSASKVPIMGILINPKLAGKCESCDILCAELEWRTDLATVLVDGGAARELAKDPVAALEILDHWLEKDTVLLAERAESACRLGRPRAAYGIAARAWRQRSATQALS